MRPEPGGVDRGGGVRLSGGVLVVASVRLHFWPLVRYVVDVPQQNRSLFGDLLEPRRVVLACSEAAALGTLRCGW